MFSAPALFFLVSVSSPTLLAFMGSYLVSFSFFTTRHKALLLIINIFLLYFYAAFYPFYKNLGWLKGGNVVRRYFNGGVLGNVPTCLFGSGLDYKTSKTS